MKSTVTALSLMLASICAAMTALACERDMEFECPDDKALQLVKLATNARDYKNYGFNDSFSAFSYVIENASRPMDEVALRRACRGLAQDLYMIEHYDSTHADVFGLIPPQEAVTSLREKYPSLTSCPYHSLFEAQLPVRRTTYVPPEEAVRLNVTGWVDLELDVSDDGKIESARIINSSDSILEHGVVDHVLTFRYPKSLHYNGLWMRRKGFQTRITTHYFHLAQANGCRLED